MFVLLTVPSATFVLFGATGDLAHRMIFPSLYNLFGDNLLPEDFLIVASGRSPLDDAAFRKDIDKGLKEFLADGLYDSHQAAKFAEMIRSEEHTSELKSLMRNSYAVFCLKNKTNLTHNIIN